MQEFKVDWFLVWVILPSGGREHQSYLSGGTNTCVCSPGRLFVLFCFFFLSYCSLTPKRPLIVIKNHQRQNAKSSQNIPFEGGVCVHCAFVFFMLFL